MSSKYISKVIKIEIYILFIILFIPLIFSQQNQLIEINYSFYNNSYQENKIDFSNLLLRVKTLNDSICKYSQINGVSFSNMEGNFDLNSGKIHEKSFNFLGDGLYKYYIKCYDNSLNIGEPAEFNLTIIVNSFVTAEIILSKETPLKAGKVDVTLITSKIVSGTPSLTYSFDGIVYNDLPLFGSEKIWKGYLLIPKNIEEKIVSFKFRANDLEGRQGTTITRGNVFVVDTIKPKIISFITAVGYEGSINLDWYFEDDDIKEFKIYRSNNPNPDYTNFYRTVDNPPFIDNLVEKGKTYYYRVSAVDNAGNEGDLSREVYATALISNVSSSTSKGLSLELLGFVQNFLIELESVITEVDRIKQSISEKSENEKVLFNDLKLIKKIDDSKLEILNLKKEIENYKLQDLSREELNKKLDAGRLRLNVIKKKIPESLVILDQEYNSEEVNEDTINYILLEINSDISDKDRQKIIKESMKIYKDLDIKIKNFFYNIEINYMDASKSQETVIKREVFAELENKENLSFIEKIPKEAVESSNEITFISGDYKIIKEDPIISYSSDTKKIIYTINRKLSLSSFKNSKIILLYNLQEKDNQTKNSLITGYFIFIKDNQSYLGIILGVILVLILFFYLIYSKKVSFSDYFIKINKDLQEVLEFVNKKNIKDAEKRYKDLKSYYKFLSKKEKKKIYPKIIKIHDKILLTKLEEVLKEFENNKSKDAFLSSQKIYDSLSEKSKKHIRHIFEKIKNDFQNDK
ncbi:MAG: hypothetical protein QXW97_00030 [Candidatus Pacearchaeota archaeon]